MKNRDELLEPAQAAAELGVRTHTLAVWRSRKNTAKNAPNLPYVKIGGRVRYRRSDIDAALANGTTNGVVTWEA